MSTSSLIKQHFSLVDMLLFAIMILWFYDGCNGRNSTVRTELLHSDTTIVRLYDTVTRIVVVDRPQPADTVKIPVPEKVDTAAILADYFTRYYYRQEVSDSLLSVTIADTIGENKILSRQFSYRILRPQIIQQIIESPRSMVLIGASASLKDAGPEILVLTKRGAGYGVGYGVVSQSVNARFYWPIYKGK